MFENNITMLLTIVIMIIGLYFMFSNDSKEHLTVLNGTNASLSNEAIQNMGSVLNTGNGTVNNLNITGALKIGNLTINNDGRIYWPSGWSIGVDGEVVTLRNSGTGKDNRIAFFKNSLVDIGADVNTNGGNMTVGGNLQVNGTATVNTSITTGNIHAWAPIEAHTGLVVSGNIASSQNITVGGDINVTGNSGVAGNISVTGNLDVWGPTIIARQDLVVKGKTRSNIV